MRFPTLLGICLLATFFFFGCNSSKDTTQSKVSDIPGKVIVLLENSVQPQKLERDLADYSLKSEGQISRAKYQFSYSFDASKIEGSDLVKKIRALPYVIEADLAQQVKE